MGYNRRALALKAIAQKVIDDHDGKTPVGSRSASCFSESGSNSRAVAAFAFNKPIVFMDTNIRGCLSIVLRDRDNIHDDEIIPFLEQTMDAANPRNGTMPSWIMGSSQEGAGQSKPPSAHYAKQSPLKFEPAGAGEDPENTGTRITLTRTQILTRTGMDQERIKNNLVQLVEEGFIQKKGAAL